MRPVLEALEERILYSADFAPSLAASLSQPVDAQPLTTSAQPVSAMQEIVFADASLADLDSLRADLDAQRATGRAIELVVIGTGEDGIAVITNTLAGRTGVTAMHLFGHGAAGTMALGGNFDVDALLGRAGEIAAWGQALSGDADILIYGCDFGSTATGVGVVNGLAALTGADVAASSDVTGAQVDAGDWLLEIRSGIIEAAVAPSPTEQIAWMQALGPVPGTTGRAIYGEHNYSAPQTSDWDGIDFGPQDTSSNLGQWLMMTGAQAPTRNESIVVGVSAGGTIRGAMWNGSTWTALPLNLMGTTGATTRTGFAVAYESQSGDAMMVWDASGALTYSIWNGTSWTAPAVIAGYTGAAPQHLQIAAQAGGDGMVLAIGDANGDLRALVWDGSSWGNAVTLDTSGTSSADQTALAVAYESQSGEALVAYARAGSADVSYRSWNGSAWSAQSSFAAPAGVTTKPQWLRLAADPLSNRLAVAVTAAASAGNAPIWFAVWDGNTFGNRILAETHGNASGPGIAVGFESTSGELLATFAVNDNRLRFMNWSAGGGWSAVRMGPDLGARPTSLALTADPNTSQLMLSAQLDNERLKLLAWDGGSWGAASELSADTDSRYGQASVFLYRLDAHGVAGNALWLSPRNDSPSGWQGVNSVYDEGIVSLGDPGLTLGVNNTSGNFTHVFSLAGFSSNDPDLEDFAYVSRDLTVAGSISLQSGDVIFTLEKPNVTLTSLNSVSPGTAALVLFRPQTPGDYSSGTFTIICQNLGSVVPGFNFNDVRGLALVETDTVVGNVTLTAGTILFSREGPGHDKNVYALTPGVAVGGRITSGTVTGLLVGAEVGINQQIRGIELVSSPTLIGDVTLPSGALLLTLEQNDFVGGNNLATAKGDVFYIKLTHTSISGTAAGNATLLVQGASLGMSGDVVDGLALHHTSDSPPVITTNGGGATAAVSVAEGSAAVTTVAATDAEGAVLSYSISGGADAARFTINSATGALAFVTAPDRETALDANGDNIYEVIVSASDGALTDSQALSVTVTNVNETPVITSGGGGPTAAIGVAELSTAVTTVVARDADGTTPVYSIAGGADAASFTIDSTTGALSFATLPIALLPLDANSDNIYEVIVRASDGVLTDSQSLSVQVLLLNFPPVITSNGGGAAGAVSVAENATAVTTVTANDFEGVMPAYAITGGADAAHFTIDPASGALSFTVPPDYETPLDANGDHVYVVVVSASDGPLSDSQTLSVTVTNVNEAPVNTVPALLATNEDEALAVTGLAVADVDAGAAPIRVVLAVGSGSIAVNAGVAGGVAAGGISGNGSGNVTLVGTVAAINATLADAAGVVYQPVTDFSGTANLTITSDDLGSSGTGGARSDTDSVVINVAAVSDVPVLLLAPAAGSEDGAIALSITPSITDTSNGGGQNERITHIVISGVPAGAVFSNAAGDTLTVSNGSLVLLPVQLAGLAVTAPPDFNGSFSLSVDVTSQDGTATPATNSGSLAVTVAPVNDAPVIDSNGGGPTAAVTVAEGSVAVGTVVASDPDGSAPTFSITGGSDAARFTIDPASGALAFAVAPDHETPLDADGDNVYEVIVQASDGALAASQMLSITVANANEAPVITSNGAGVTAAVTVPQGTTAVTTVGASDPEGIAPMFSIVGGADAARFIMDPATGVLTFITAPDTSTPLDADGDNVYELTVQASDGTLTDNQALFVTVSRSNQAPVITSNGGGAAAVLGVAEGNTPVTTFAATDAEGTSLQYAIVGGADAARFVIDPSSGALSFVSARDYEAPQDADGNNVYEVVVQASDGVLTDSQALSVMVSNVNEAPAIQSNGGASNASVAVVESNAAVTIVAAVDPDATSPTYSIIGGADAARFAIDSASGALSFVGARDYEAPQDADGDNVYEVIVKASDGALSDTQAISVSVTNTNDAPMNTVPGALTTPQLTALSITGVSVADVDSGGSPIRVDLGVTGGVLTVNSAAAGGVTAAGISNNGSSNITLIGTVAQINATLANSGAGIVYQPMQGFTGAASLAVLSNDLGNSGAGGPATDSDAVLIEVMSASADPVEPALTTESPPPPAEGSVRTADTAGTPTAPRTEATAVAPQPASDPFASNVDAERVTGVEPLRLAGPMTSTAEGRSAATRYAAAVAIASDSPFFARLDFGVPPIAPGQFAEATSQPDFRRQLDEVRRQLDKRIASERGTVGMSTALAGGLTAGYVIWIVRGGVLLSSLVSSLPAWHLVDPLPVLYSKKAEEESDEADDHVERLFSGGAGNTGQPDAVRPARWRSWLRIGSSR